MAKSLGNQMKIIAEVGFNHDNDLKQALEYVSNAKAAGAHAIKFQTYRAQDIALPSSEHFNAIKDTEIDYEFHKVIFEKSKELDIEFISTPFSPWAVDLLEKLGVSSYKVSSMDCTNLHLLGLIAETKKAMFVSTGMADFEEISNTFEFLNQKKSGEISFLHCVSNYPACLNELDLFMIQKLKSSFPIQVGYSDHSKGIEACLAAHLLGASVIEKHFTIDGSRTDGDHIHSCDAEQLKLLIDKIELQNIMLGESQIERVRSDRQQKPVFRRGLYFSREMKQGEKIEADCILMCRPEGPLGPNDYHNVLGRTMSEGAQQYQQIDKRHLA